MNIETKKLKYWIKKLKKEGFKNLDIQKHESETEVYIIRY